MKCFIKGQEYKYIDNALKDDSTRKRYFQLAKQVFRLEFEKWYQSDYWDNRFIPYIIMHEDIVVSSVAVCINDICWKDQQKRYVQISTVMTLPEYRNQGLSRYLMETVLSEWEDKCEAIYLLSNDSVVNFYPKFGFESFKEFQFSKSITHSNGIYRKLNVEDPDDWRLIIEKYKIGNPFSALVVENTSQFVFHCMYSFSKDIYYLGEYDAVAIVQFENDRLFCYDVFTNRSFQLNDMLQSMANANTKVAYLGFTPKSEEDYIIEESQEQNTHLFVLNGKENIFKNNRIVFSMLSRA